MKQTFRNIYLLAVLLMATQLYAQRSFSLKDPQPVYRNFSVAQGLPSSETYYVHQDKKGYIWICTDRGVVRFDGYRFRVFTKKDGLPDNVVFRIQEDRFGRLWFISYSGLLSYYENGKIHGSRHNDLIRRKTTGLYLPFKCLVVRKDGSICYSLLGKGYMVLYPDGKADLSHFGEIPFGKEVIRFHHEEDEPWIELRVSSRVESSELFEMGRTFIQEKDRMIEIDKIHLFGSIIETQVNGQSFICINKNASLLKGKAFVPRTEMGKTIITFCVAGGQLWVGNAGEGVTSYDVLKDGTPRKRNSLLANFSVTHVMRDRDGGYWFSTLEKGVFYAPNMAVRHLTTVEGMPFQSALRLAGYGNNVYAASGSSFFQQLNAPWRKSMNGYSYPHYNMAVLGKRIYTPDSPIRENIKVVSMGPSESDMYQGNGKILQLIRTKVVRVHADLSCDTLSLEIDKQQSAVRIAAITEDANETIWYSLGTYLYRRRRSGESKRFSFGKEVYDMAWSKRWGLIVATKDDGVYFLRDDGTVRLHLTQQEGLPADIVSVVKVDHRDRLWIGTNQGASLVLPEHRKPRIITLNTRKGLVSDEIADFYIYGDKAWVATKMGVDIVDINALSTNAEFRPLLLTGIGSSEHPSGGERTFDSDVSFIKVQFRTLDYRSSSMLQFRYRTQRDGSWVYAKTPEVLLTDPGSGDYVVEVSYRNVDGEWSSPTTLTRFTVLPPYYARWYVVALLVLLVMGGMYLLFRLRLRQINRRNHLQKTINRLEQKALRAQMNPHFIFNSLNSIQSFLLYEENEKAEKYLLRFARLIRQTLNNSRESCITIESEMETLRGYLELEQMRFKEKFTFEIVCELSPEELQYGVPPMLIQPFVENAVLHGFKTMETGGRIEVRFEKLENQRLLCIVEDNGIGRKATMQAKPEGHKSFGTKITEERLAAFRQKYGDEFSIETIDKEANGKPEGTKVVMHIPVVAPGEYEGAEES